MDRVFLGNSLQSWLVAALVVVLGWLLGRLARFILTRWVVRLTARTGTQLDDKIISKSAQPLGIVVTLAATHVALAMLTLGDGARRIAEGAVVAAIAITVAIVVMRIIDAVSEEILDPWAARQSPPVHPQVLHIGRIVLKVVAGTLAMVTVMQRAGFDVWSVITGLGIGGVAVALAAQQTLGNVFGSLQVMTDRPFGVGDFVTIDRFSGRVLEIGLRSTRLQTTAGEVIVIPNKHVAEAAVQNLMAPQGQIREFHLGLTYSTTPAQVEQACALVSAVLRRTPGVHPEFLVQFTHFDESSLRLRVIYRVPDPARFGEVAHQVNLAILQDFNAEGLSFAFPTRTLHWTAKSGAAAPVLD